MFVASFADFQIIPHTFRLEYKVAPTPLSLMLVSASMIG
jgi:hypothetical protein